jgi:hypothetical protein
MIKAMALLYESIRIASRNVILTVVEDYGIVV